MEAHRRGGRWWLCLHKRPLCVPVPPLEESRLRRGAWLLVGFRQTSGSSHWMSGVWREGWGKQSVIVSPGAHLPLQESSCFLLPVYKSWREAIPADEPCAAVGMDVFVTCGARAPCALRAGVPGFTRLPSPRSRSAWQGWRAGVQRLFGHTGMGLGGRGELLHPRRLFASV